MSVFAEKHYPDSVVGKALDDYLALGWYRMGQSIFTTHFLCFGEQIYSAIWIRLIIQDHRFRKSQRKLLRKNGDQFTIRYAPLSITPEKEALYQKYKKNFPGYIASSLSESLLDGEEFNVFRTMETQIYFEDQLVGLSFFDLGDNSVASILGIYDPAFESHSLGYYSMLLEMQYCREHQIDIYYPGYIVPGYERFEYKLRIGNVEFLRLADYKWAPIDNFSVDGIPLNKMRSKLMLADEAFKEKNIATHLFYYPLFEANLFGMLQASYLDFPVLLRIRTSYPTPQFEYFLIFDVRDGHYKLLRCSNFDDFRFYFNDAYTSAFDPERFLIELTIVEQVLIKTTNVQEMVEVVSMYFEKLV